MAVFPLIVLVLAIILVLVLAWFVMADRPLAEPRRYVRIVRPRTAPRRARRRTVVTEEAPASTATIVEDNLNDPGDD